MLAEASMAALAPQRLPAPTSTVADPTHLTSPPSESPSPREGLGWVGSTHNTEAGRNVPGSPNRTDSPPPPTGHDLGPSTQDSPLPALSNPDESLLSQYLSLNLNLEALAAQSQVPVLRLIRWLNLPHIAEYLAAFDLLRARQAAAEDRADRRAAIDCLKLIQSTTEDPIEKRRAATAILRALSVKNPRSPSPHAAPPAPTQARPRATPSPELSAHQTASVILNALTDPDEPDDDSGLATLHAFCAKGAAINDQPVPEDFTDFLDDFSDELAPFLPLGNFAFGPRETTPEGPIFTAYFCHNTRAGYRAAILLTQESPTHPHRIKSLKIHPPTPADN